MMMMMKKWRKAQAINFFFLSNYSVDAVHEIDFANINNEDIMNTPAGNNEEIKK